MKYRLASALVLVLAAFGAIGCSGSTSSSEAPAADDQALKAFSEGRDARIPLLDAPATPSPKALPAIASWSIEYDDIAPQDPDPNNRYRGVLLIAKDATGAPALIVPKAILEDGIATLYFEPHADDDGNLVAFPLDLASSDPDRARDARDAVDWIRSESTRLGNLVSSSLLGEDSPTAQSLELKIQGGSKLTNGLECAAHIAVFALAFSNPITFLVADAAVTIVGGAINGELGKGVAGGAVDLSLAGTVKVVGKAVGASAAKKVLPAAAVLAVGYEVYEGKSLAQIAGSFVPTSCKNVFK